MKRFIVILLVLVLTVVAIVGCSGTLYADNVKTSGRFVGVYYQKESSTQSIVVFADTETGVMYLYRKNGYSGGMTVMVDAEGKPLIWDPQKEEKG